MARATSPRDVSRHVSTARYALRVGLCAPVHAIRRDGAHTASDRLPICATGANTAARRLTQYNKNVIKFLFWSAL